jgi:protein associated with RNAse G/E
MSKRIWYNLSSICSNQGEDVRCDCGNRYAGIETTISVIDTDKKTWTQLPCPDCIKKENNNE